MTYEGALTTSSPETSEPVKVDNSAPNAPTLKADRSPDYAGGGGWYKDSVTVTTTANGDPKIGRASCRERVDRNGGAGEVNNMYSGKLRTVASRRVLGG